MQVAEVGVQPDLIGDRLVPRELAAVVMVDGAARDDGSPPSSPAMASAATSASLLKTAGGR